MKKFIKSSILAIVLVSGTSCTLDLLVDPNNIPVNNADPKLLLNAIQINTAGLFNTASTFGMQLTRLQNSGGNNYNNFATPVSFNGMWSTSYASILKDADVLIAAADANGWTEHSGRARILAAYVLSILVDYFGDVPFSQAFDGVGNPNPTVDNSRDLYDEILAMLDQGITDLNTAPAPGSPSVDDLYYSGNLVRWKKFANTVKLKLWLNRRKVDTSLATTAINNLLDPTLTPDGLIINANESFIFRYGTNVADPDSRSPRYTGNYLTGAGTYMSNYLMWQMFYGWASPTESFFDPRIRFYFYRQRNANSSDPNEIRCILETQPLHYPAPSGTTIVSSIPGWQIPPGMSTNPAHPAWSTPNRGIFCYPTNVGYWGRDHIDNQGIPPDGLARTTFGPYPHGGRFDNNVNVPVTNAAGAPLSMLGAGFQPIMMRAFTFFMLAEAKNYLSGVTNNLTGFTTVADYLTQAVRVSMDDVYAWSVNGTLGTNAFGPSPNQQSLVATIFPTVASFNTARDTYISRMLNATVGVEGMDGFNAQSSADGRMNIIAREYWIALYGNGVEMYNLYRRTGMPLGMQPALNPNPLKFPRSMWYPQTAATLNANLAQKSDLGERVLFWDVDPPTPNIDF